MTNTTLNQNPKAQKQAMMFMYFNKNSDERSTENKVMIGSSLVVHFKLKNTRVRAITFALNKCK
jgi:hypothetical protein